MNNETIKAHLQQLQIVATYNKQLAEAVLTGVNQVLSSLEESNITETHTLESIMERINNGESVDIK